MPTMPRAPLAVLLVVVAAACRARSRGPEDEIRAIAALPPASRSAAVDRFVAAHPETPILEGTRAYVYWKGEARRVQWIGDACDWDRSRAPDLVRVPGTDLWWAVQDLPAAARLDYKLLLDGDDWRLDPRCPRTCAGGYGPNSELRMPGYRLPPELLPSSSGRAVPPGRLEKLSIRSEALGGDRSFWVYQPAGAAGAKGLGSVWFHDGDGYLQYAGAAATLDRLIADGDIPPVVGVFVPPVHRGDELGVHGDAYLRFVCDELVPRVRQRFGVSADPDRTVTLGISLGGSAAVRFALRRPDVFARAAGHSGAYNDGDDVLVREVREGPTRPVRFHLIVGTYERALGGDPVGGNLLEAQRRLVRALADRGYAYDAHEYPEGHSWGLWKAHLGDALRYLLGPPRPAP